MQLLDDKRETFHWSPRPGLSVESQPQVKVARFGDGYEQRQPAGLNNQLKSYQPVFRVTPEQLPSLESFLARHGAVKGFYWKEPYTHKLITVVCRKWSSTVYQRYGEVRAVFDQVIS